MNCLRVTDLEVRADSDLELHKSNVRILGSYSTATSEVHRCQEPDTLTPCGQKPSF